VTLSASSSNIKGYPNSDKNPIWKKPIRISDNITVIAIPESIVQKLEIDEDTWFELTATIGEIILKISSKKVGSSNIVEASRV
jgi:hypothetical protein